MLKPKHFYLSYFAFHFAFLGLEAVSTLIYNYVRDFVDILIYYVSN